MIKLIKYCVTLMGVGLLATGCATNQPTESAYVAATATVEAGPRLSVQEYVQQVESSWDASKAINEKILPAFDNANTTKDFAALKELIIQGRTIHQQELDRQQAILASHRYPEDAQQLQRLVVNYFDASVEELVAFLALAEKTELSDNQFIDGYNAIIDSHTSYAEGYMDLLERLKDEYSASHQVVAEEQPAGQCGCGASGT